MNDLFIDKLSISAAIIRKEGDLVTSYSQLVNEIDWGFIKKDKVTEDSKYSQCLNILHELYTFMRFNKISEYREKNKEDVEYLENFMSEYENIDREKRLTFEELKKSINIILEIISKSGYHDDTTRKEFDEDDF